ncbi:hypothetical protein EPUL_000173 [Erysiphe pulchra]|uniref:Uncharacterized protein n=1 Tax=Erysiphe pulchra TaxID=225359 RepID=A0A2S4Q2D7_9PEZI|nr:hypothetical protein EPUL_000173 [Erysiphe pulchra]
MKNGHFIKCKRVDESVPEPPLDDPNVKYNYKCGHDLLSHEVIQFSAETAVSSLGKNKVFPIPYEGNLYRPELKYWIYPVMRANKAHKVRTMPESTYLVVVSAAGELIDVIAELRNRDFIKCTKTIEVTDTNIDEDEDLRSGYLCDLEFFNTRHIKHTAALAKARQESKSSVGVYPKNYFGPTLERENWIFPLLPSGMLYGGVARPYKYFLIMNTEFQVEYAAMKTPEGIRPCEVSTRSLGAVPSETDDFKCRKTEFSNKFLQEVVQVACKSLGTNRRRFPGKYQGPPFAIEGPYVTWPIVKGKQLAGSNKYPNFISPCTKLWRLRFLILILIFE